MFDFITFCELESWGYSYKDYMEEVYTIDSRRFEKNGFPDKAGYIPENRLQAFKYHMASLHSSASGKLSTPRQKTGA